MGRSPSSFCAKDDEECLNRGAWTASEDEILREFIRKHGAGRWASLPKQSGLKRSGKSCRLRWLNYLRPDIKRGNICPDEEELIVRLHRLLGNRWALIAGRLPGRTDNELKNYWITHLSRRVEMGEFEPKFHKPLKRMDVPSYSNYDEERVLQKDNYTSQSEPFKSTAFRYSCEGAVVDLENLDSYNNDHVLDTHDVINTEEALKAADDHVVEIETDISKSWCQLMLEDCLGDYQYDRWELTNGLQANCTISSSYGTDEHHQFPYFSSLLEVDSSSCNIVDQAFPRSELFNSRDL